MELAERQALAEFELDATAGSGPEAERSTARRTTLGQPPPMTPEMPWPPSKARSGHSWIGCQRCGPRRPVPAPG